MVSKYYYQSVPYLLNYSQPRLVSIPSSPPSKGLYPPDKLPGYPSSNESDNTPSPEQPAPVRRQLRERHGEFRPYTKDKKDRRRQVQGKPPLTQDHIGGVSGTRAESPPQTGFKCKINARVEVNPSSSYKVSKSSKSATSVKSEDQDVVTTEEKMARTTLYVVLAGITNPTVPIFLRSCQTVEGLFDKIANAWNLAQEEMELVTVHFPWIQAHNTIVVKKSIPDTFEKMIMEILESPCWDLDGQKRCEVEVKVYKSPQIE